MLPLMVLAEVRSEVNEDATCCICLMSLRVTMVDLGLGLAMMTTGSDMDISNEFLAFELASSFEVATFDDIYEVIDEVDE